MSGISLVAVSRGYSLLVVCRLLIAVASLVQSMERGTLMTQYELETGKGSWAIANDVA